MKPVHQTIACAEFEILSIMKRSYKYLLSIAFNGLMCLFIASSADAQHRDAGGGGGGRPSAPAPSSGGSRSSAPAPSVSRPQPSSVNNSRPSSIGISRPPSSNGGSYSRPSVGVSNPRVAISPSRINGGSYNRPNQVGISPYRGPRNNAIGVASVGGRGYSNSNARSYVGGRGYIGAGGRASVGVGGRGFYGSSYWRNRGYYHYYHGYYNTYYGPRLGFSIGYLPYGYYPFYFGDYQYFYSDGLYYQYNNSEYTVVEPPIGAEITTLPEKAQSIVINGQQYYELNGVYYLPITKDDGTVSYEIAGKDGELNTQETTDGGQQVPQIGDIVESLPPDCRTIKLNGEKYYVSQDGYYYQEARDANNNKVYKIVGTPEDGPSN